MDIFKICIALYKKITLVLYCMVSDEKWLQNFQKQEKTKWLNSQLK